MTLIGSIIDANYVQAANPDITNPTRLDLASAAIQAQSVNQSDVQGTANAYIKEIDQNIVTAVMIYNATGTTLSFRSTSDSSGEIWKYPYDTLIQNGQWSVFLHKSATGAATGSIALLAYNIEDHNNTPVAVLGWNVPETGDNSAWGDCWNSTGFAREPWSKLFDDLDNGGLTGNGNGTSGNGYSVPYSIGTGGKPIAQFMVRAN